LLASRGSGLEESLHCADTLNSQDEYERIVQIGWSEINTTIFVQSPYLGGKISLNPLLPKEKAVLEAAAQSEKADCSKAVEIRIEDSHPKLTLLIKEILSFPGQTDALRVICSIQRMTDSHA